MRETAETDLDLLSIRDLMRYSGESESAWRKRLGRRELPYIRLLDALCRQTIDEIQAEIIGYDERVAIRADAFDDHRNTTQRAIAALQRSERFPGRT